MEYSGLFVRSSPDEQQIRMQFLLKFLKHWKKAYKMRLHLYTKPCQTSPRRRGARGAKRRPKKSMMREEMLDQVSSSGKHFSTSSTSYGVMKTRPKSEVKENINNGSEDKTQLIITPQRKEHGQGNKKSALNVVTFTRIKEDCKSTKLGNTDDRTVNKKQMEARKVFAMAHDQEETVFDAETDVLLDRTEDLLAESQKFIDDTLANDDTQHQAHKTSVDASSTDFKVKCLNFSKSKPSDTAAQNPLEPTLKNIAKPAILKEGICTAAEDENFFEIENTTLLESILKENDVFEMFMKKQSVEESGKAMDDHDEAKKLPRTSTGVEHDL